MSKKTLWDILLDGETVIIRGKQPFPRVHLIKPYGQLCLDDIRDNESYVGHVGLTQLSSGLMGVVATTPGVLTASINNVALSFNSEGPIRNVDVHFWERGDNCAVSVPLNLLVLAD